MIPGCSLRRNVTSFSSNATGDTSTGGAEPMDLTPLRTSSSMLRIEFR